MSYFYIYDDGHDFGLLHSSDKGVKYISSITGMSERELIAFVNALNSAAGFVIPEGKEALVVAIEENQD